MLQKRQKNKSVVLESMVGLFLGGWRSKACLLTLFLNRNHIADYISVFRKIKI
jgi:hypothetical protein